MSEKPDLFGSVTVILLVSLVATSINSAAYHQNRFIRIPEPIQYGEVGGKITVIWHFHIEERLPSKTKIEDFLFGVWAPPGYVKYKILYLDSNHMVKTRPGYQDKLHYNVNISHSANCSAIVTLLKLVPRDFKKYGIDILVGLDRSPLINTFELRAPPRITKFPSSGLNVTEGKKTAIECRAEGIPAPFVAIQRDSETLCNGTRHCQYVIESVDTEHEGKYECSAWQGEKSDNKSVRLVVRRKGEEHSGARKSSYTLVIAVAVGVAILVAAMIFTAIYHCKCKGNKSHEVKKDEAGKFLTI